MNLVKEFFTTLFILSCLAAIPLVLIPDLRDQVNELGIGVWVLVGLLLIILSIPRSRR